MLLSSVSTATDMWWRMSEVTRRSSARRQAVGVDYDSRFNDETPPMSQLEQHHALQLFDALTELSEPEQRRALQLYDSMKERCFTEGVVDLHDKNGPVHLGPSVPGTGGKKLYMKIAGSNQRVTLMNPWHVLAAKGYKPWTNNLAVMPACLAESMTDKAVPMNVVIAFVLASQNVLARGAGPCQ
jgi:hypothetical protein